MENDHSPVNCVFEPSRYGRLETEKQRRNSRRSCNALLATYVRLPSNIGGMQDFCTSVGLSKPIEKMWRQSQSAIPSSPNPTRRTSIPNLVWCPDPSQNIRARVNACARQGGSGVIRSRPRGFECVRLRSSRPSTTYCDISSLH